jgi:hypothetical protein
MQFAGLERQWAKPLALRVAKGWAIEGLRVENYEKGLVKECPKSCVNGILNGPPIFKADG